MANGETVALFCFNRLLGEWLQNYFVQQPINLRPVYVGTLHGYMRNILVAHGKNISVSDDLDEDEKQHYYSEVLPQMAIDCLYSDTAKFDRIIVDEAQDIISESYLNFLGSCIKSDPPRTRFIAGILFPREVKEDESAEIKEGEMEDIDLLEMEDDGEVLPQSAGDIAEYLEDAEELINRSNAYRQSAISMTVAINTGDQIRIEVSAGKYKTLSFTDSKSGKQSTHYPRTAIEWNNNNNPLE